jgi:hypothetical protein
MLDKSANKGLGLVPVGERSSFLVRQVDDLPAPGAARGLAPDAQDEHLELYRPVANHAHSLAEAAGRNACTVALNIVAAPNAVEQKGGFRRGRGR